MNVISEMDSQSLYESYKSHLRKIADVKYALAVLQWDQETYMPQKGAGFRARQVATLSELAHSLFTEERFRNLLLELKGRDDLDELQQRNIACTWHDFSQQEKLPVVFVRELSEAVSRSFQSWITARKQDDFGYFKQDLETLVALKKKEADLLGYEQHPYNALLDQYERGATVSMLDELFGKLQPPLKELIGTIAGRPQADNSVLKQFFPKQQQWEFGMQLLKALGFDFSAGRQDISEHPFTTNFSSEDVRVTTRIDENDFGNMTWSCIHECGHALYEQGLPAEQYGLPLGEYASLGIHESQSRLWENNVGRSAGAWEYFYPLAKQFFPARFSNLPLTDFYRVINRVQPSLIRTEADELTYHFHVIIRYELEKKLLEGSLPVAEIPHYWNEQYRLLLGLTVPGDKQGCLQDVHWSHGSFGYFPTYSLGSLYAAQFFDAAQRQVTNLDTEIRKGNFKPLLEWLRIHIHAHGRRFTSRELCERITGQPLDIRYFMQYAQDKYRSLYV